MLILIFFSEDFVTRPVAFDLLEKIKSCQMDIIDNVVLDSPKIYFIVSVNCIFHILKCIYQIFQDVKHMSFMLFIRINFCVQCGFFHAHPCHIFVYIFPVYSSALQRYSLRLKFRIMKPEVGVCVIGGRPRGVTTTVEGEQHYAQDFNLSRFL